jgi:hypothetical protein
MPIIFEENFTELLETQATRLETQLSPTKRLQQPNTFIMCIKPNKNGDDYNEQNIVNSKSYPNKLNNLAVVPTHNIRSASTASTTSSSSNDTTNNNNNNNLTKKSNDFLKRSKKTNKDIIASETNTIKLVSYRKVNENDDFIYSQQPVQQSFLVKNELTSSLPIKSVNKKTFIFKKLSVDDEDLNKKDTDRRRRNSVSSNETISTSYCENNGNLELKKEISIYSLPNMQFNERPIDVESIEPKIIISKDDLIKNSTIDECENLKNNNNLIAPPSDCSYKSKVLYESFRGRTNTLDRRRLNQGTFNKNTKNESKLFENENATSTPIKTTRLNDFIAKLGDDLKANEQLSIKTVSNSLSSSVNDHLYK